MGQAAAVDDLMQKASKALLDTSYFEAERLCCEAVMVARRANDFERMSRIVLPLQEARRQNRHLAMDSGYCVSISELPKTAEALHAGCYLLRPPLIGAQARELRALLDGACIPAVVLTREPRTSQGKWPIVAVAIDRSFRTQVAVPRTGDAEVAENAAPEAGWFMQAIELLGDVAIAKLKESDPAVFRVDDLWEAMVALPEHEKLHQRFALECVKAMHEPTPERLRRRGIFEDLSTF